MLSLRFNNPGYRRKLSERRRKRQSPPHNRASAVARRPWPPWSARRGQPERPRARSDSASISGSWMPSRRSCSAVLVRYSRLGPRWPARPRDGAGLGLEVHAGVLPVPPPHHEGQRLDLPPVLQLQRNPPLLVGVRHQLALPHLPDRLRRLPSARPQRQPLAGRALLLVQRQHEPRRLLRAAIMERTTCRSSAGIPAAAPARFPPARSRGSRAATRRRRPKGSVQWSRLGSFPSAAASRAGPPPRSMPSADDVRVRALARPLPNP
jgi:hypothetical protein